ncbi:Uncharacterised protein [Enterobacter cloacae]|nr:Uncharacterised protein [Enterobacter cloacae]
MQRGAVEAPLLGFVILHKEVEQLGHGRCNRVAHGAEAFNIVCHNLCPMRHVQPRHHNRQARLEDDFRGFRVNEDVELCCWRPVPQPHCPAHDDDTGDVAVQFRMAVQQQRYVGLRAGRHQRHGLCALTQHLRHELDGSAVLRCEIRLR